MTAASARYPGRAPIDAYGNGGFRFADMSHRGSILCLPSGIYAWPAADAGGLDASRLRAGARREAELGLLLLGTGRAPGVAGAEFRRAFAEAGYRARGDEHGCCLPHLQRAAGRRPARSAPR